LILEENSIWVHDFFDKNPKALYFGFVPLSLYLGVSIILLIFGGFIDLLEYYHKLRSEGISVDKAFIRVSFIILISLVVLVGIYFFRW
jgi:hypothetical protein